MRAPLAVGWCRWRGGQSLASVIVQLRLSFDARGDHIVARIAEPASLSLGQREGEKVSRPSDFVVFKRRCDLLLAGHAHAGAPQERIDVGWRLGGARREVVARADPPARMIPLIDGHLWDRDGEPAAPMGPAGEVVRERSGEDVGAFDFDSQQSAHPAQQVEQVAADAELILTGLSPRGTERSIRLPGVEPRVFLELRGAVDEAMLRLDTVAVDTDFEAVTLTWRAPVFIHERIDRIVVALERADAPHDHDAVLRRLPRGEVFFAVEEEDLRGDPYRDDDRLEMARYELAAAGAEPEITLEQYAAISAELAEQREERKEVLDRHGFDERTWMIEERGWLERMAERATAGDGTLMAEYGEIFAAAQRSLAGPDEPRPMEEYAEILVAIERSDDPQKVLDSRGIGMGEWIRLDAHWTEKATEDASVSEALKQELSRLRGTEDEA